MDIPAIHHVLLARVEERVPAGDDLVVVAMEFTTRGVCALWPQLLQRDTLSRYRLRGPLCKRLIDCYGVRWPGQRTPFDKFYF